MTINQSRAELPVDIISRRAHIPYTYGGEDGQYELAVLAGNKDKWVLTYDTPITEDVIGHLSESAVSTLLGQIAALSNT